MTRYANAQTSTQFDPSQYISKKHYKYQKGGAQKRPQSNGMQVAFKIAAPYSFFIDNDQ